MSGAGFPLLRPELLTSRVAPGAGPQGRWHLATVRQGVAPIPPPATRDGVFALPAYTGVWIRVEEPASMLAIHRRRCRGGRHSVREGGLDSRRCNVATME